MFELIQLIGALGFIASVVIVVVWARMAIMLGIVLPFRFIVAVIKERAV